MKLSQKLLFYRNNPHMLEVSRNYRKKKNNNKKVLQVAVVGCGGGGLMHLSHYLWHKNAMVKYAFDIDESRFVDINSRFPFAYNDIKCTTNFEEILNDKTVDIISIASPDHTHAFYAIKAIEAGKHVLCEKPMCTSISDGEKIISASKKSDRVFAVFQQMRFVPRNRAIKSLIDKGQLGEIYYINTGYIHDMRERAFEFSEWRKDPVNFQHPLYGGIHHIDILRWLAGDIDEVYTIATNKGFPELPTDDTYLMELKLKNGGIGSITTCFSPRVPKEYHPMRIYGTKGAVHGNKIFLDKNGEIIEKQLKNSEYQGVPQFRAQISDFISAVEGKVNNIVLPEDAQKTVASCAAAIESWKSGLPVKVKN